MRIVLVAGEASGDQLGAGLIEALRRLQPDARFAGVAGPAMQAAGCEAWVQAEELAVMGLAEVLRHLPRLARLRHSLVQRILADPPDVYVGIDAPDFNLRVAPLLRAAGIRTIQYVSPSVWAWRQGRVKLLREACDRVLCLLPFEAPFLEAAGVSATFVGHPLADAIPLVRDRETARRSLGLSAGPVVGLLPGSRLGEVSRLAAPFLGAANILARDFPGMQFVAPMATPAVRKAFAGELAGHSPEVAVQLVDGRAREVMAASDGLLVASGTATLEAALVGCPMVAAYRFSALTYWLARGLRLIKVKHFSLPNLLAGEVLVPELLQSEASATRLAGELGAILRSPERQQQLGVRFAGLHRELRRDASMEAARATLAVAACPR
ncbi:MAG: lipid-A-disaccharide synthase [Gammaproteobacteria bacterium]|nr:lipid-A-disaccharide synthase [Gammaproteobacteria bacterium]